MPGGFRLNMPTAPQTYRTAAPQNGAPAHQGGEEHTATSQVAVQNPNPLPHLQVRPGFRLRQSMEQSNVTTGSPVPQRSDGRPFCLSYHLKGVCNSNCGYRHAHRTLSLHEQGTLSTCKSRFCSETHPVAENSTPPWTPGGGSVRNTTISTRSRRSQSSRGTRSRDTRPWQTTPPVAAEKSEIT